MLIKTKMEELEEIQEYKYLRHMIKLKKNNRNEIKQHIIIWQKPSCQEA